MQSTEEQSSKSNIYYTHRVSSSACCDSIHISALLIANVHKPPLAFWNNTTSLLALQNPTLLMGDRHHDWSYLAPDGDYSPHRMVFPKTIFVMSTTPNSKVHVLYQGEVQVLTRCMLGICGKWLSQLFSSSFRHCPG